VKLRFLPQAYADVERLHDFLSPKNSDAADRVADLLFESARSLKDTPRKGRPLQSGFRELIVPFGKGAYVLRYRVDEAKGAILIVRIWHSREQRQAGRSTT
jgi:addiction module RelE/StbE family toxin